MNEKTHISINSAKDRHITPNNCRCDLVVQLHNVFNSSITISTMATNHHYKKKNMEIYNNKKKSKTIQE